MSLNLTGIEQQARDPNFKPPMSANEKDTAFLVWAFRNRAVLGFGGQILLPCDRAKDLQQKIKEIYG